MTALAESVPHLIDGGREIARLVGHASSKVTETVYRHQLRPVMTTGAETMDALLGAAG